MSINKIIIAGLIFVLAISCSENTNRAYKEEVYQTDYINGKLDARYLKEENEYDLNGNLISSVDYTEDGGFESWGPLTKYIYDEIGNLLSEREYNENGYVTSQTTYRYDSNRNLIREIIQINGRVTEIDSFAYQNDSLIERWSWSREDEEKSRLDFSSKQITTWPLPKKDYSNTLKLRKSIVYDDRMSVTKEI